MKIFLNIIGLWVFIVSVTILFLILYKNHTLKNDFYIIKRELHDIVDNNEYNVIKWHDSESDFNLECKMKLNTPIFGVEIRGNHNVKFLYYDSGSMLFKNMK